jgi:CDP-paratose 2-epimerase
VVKILVTGHLGFVGQNLCRYWEQSGRQYTVYGADKRMEEMYADLSNEDVAIALIKQASPDIIVHLASSVSTPGSLERPMETFRDTVRAGVNVLEGARETGTPVILTSSVKARDGMTPYGASKVMVEVWAEEYMESYGLPIVVNRPGTIYGPGQEGSPESGWIAWFSKARAMDLEVTINGDGSQVRDLLYVEDYCHLITHQIEEFGIYAGQVWDVGGGPRNAVSVKEMADYMGLNYKYGPRRKGDADTYIGENKTPTWEPQTYWKDQL